MTASGKGLVGHAGAVLLRKCADQVGLTEALGGVLPVGIPITETIRTLIVDTHDWVPALAADGVGLRDGAEVCEITHMLPAKPRAGLPADHPDDPAA